MLVQATLAILLSAALLFTVQPLLAKALLPLLGGSPAVWNTCMVFFQAVLLAGYAYADLVTRRLRPAAQLALQLVVLALPFAVPLALRWSHPPPPGGSPIGWLLVALCASVGLPFFALSTTGPLVQRWFAATTHPQAHDPYFLYAASNLGSLGGLLAYPVLCEPWLALSTPRRLSPGGALLPSQIGLWGVLYAVFALSVALAGLLTLRRRRVEPAEPVAAHVERLAPSRVLWWLFLAFVPSSALIGATQYISTDIAAVPLLWVLPLAAYLVTFMVAFARRSRVPSRAWSAALALLVVAAAASLWGLNVQLVWLRLPLHLLTLVAVGLVCHGRLACDRPAPERLTTFYLTIALGGVLGGIFNALVAPVLFRDVVEYPLVLMLACWARPGRTDVRTAALTRLLDGLVPVLVAALIVLPPPLLQRLGVRPAAAIDALLIGVPCGMALLASGRRARFALSAAVLLSAGFWRSSQVYDVEFQTRTFFGVHRVARILGPPLALLGSDGREQVIQVPFRVLLHGRTRHGAQALTPELTGRPTSYFHATGPVGQVFERLEARGGRRVALIGLGAGTLAAYGKPGQQLTYYEIDAAVARIAIDPSRFTFIRDSPASIEIVIGDGRLELGRAPDGSFDMVLIDAFSSDAIPVHLLTREAFELYLRQLRPGGVLALHLTNTYLDLVPVAGAIVSDLDLVGFVRRDTVTDSRLRAVGKNSSTWALIARDASALAGLETDPRWSPLGATPEPALLWTDDYSNVLRVLRLFR